MTTDFMVQLTQLIDGTIERIDLTMKERLFKLASAKISWHEDSIELRKAVHAVLVEGLTQQEAADANGVRQTSVSRAIKNIHDALTKIGENEGYVLWTGFVTTDALPVLDHIESKGLEPLERDAEKNVAKKAKRKTSKK